MKKKKEEEGRAPGRPFLRTFCLGPLWSSLVNVKDEQEGRVDNVALNDALLT